MQIQDDRIVLILSDEADEAVTILERNIELLIDSVLKRKSALDLIDIASCDGVDKESENNDQEQYDNSFQDAEDDPYGKLLLRLFAPYFIAVRNVDPDVSDS